MVIQRWSPLSKKINGRPDDGGFLSVAKAVTQEQQTFKGKSNLSTDSYQSARREAVVSKRQSIKLRQEGSPRVSVRASLMMERPSLNIKPLGLSILPSINSSIMSRKNSTSNTKPSLSQNKSNPYIDRQATSYISKLRRLL